MDKISSAPTVYRISDKNSPEWQVAKDVEAQVFIEAGYVESSHELDGEYSSYLQETSFILACDNGKAVGAVRLITPDAKEPKFKTLDDMLAGRLHTYEDSVGRIANIGLSNIIEIGTISVKPEHRAGRALLELYGAIYKLSEGDRYMLASFDDKPEGSYLKSFEKYFGNSVLRLGDPRMYMGSLTVPTLVDLELAMSNTEQKRPKFAELMKSTIVLDDIS